MALFKAVPGRRDLIYDTYSRDISQEPLPKYQMPNKPVARGNGLQPDPRRTAARRQTRGKNTATFCTTFVSPEAQKLMQECVDKKHDRPG